jgi:hypothetical protein
VPLAATSFATRFMFRICARSNARRPLSLSRSKLRLLELPPLENSSSSLSLWLVELFSLGMIGPDYISSLAATSTTVSSSAILSKISPKPNGDLTEE